MDAPRYLIWPLGYVQLSINRSMYFSKKEQPIIEAKLIIEFIQTFVSILMQKIHFHALQKIFWTLSTYSTLSNKQTGCLLKIENLTYAFSPNKFVKSSHLYVYWNYIYIFLGV